MDEMTCDIIGWYSEVKFGQQITKARFQMEHSRIWPPCINEFHHGPAPGFNEYHRGVSSFNPQKHVNTAKIVARVSLNTGQKKKKYESVSFETLL